MIPNTTIAIPAIDSSTPTGSSRPGVGFRESGTSRAISTSAMATIGTLTKNTEPHQKCASSRPPVTGPMAIARPTAPAQIPIAFGRSVGSKTFEMIDSVDGSTAAPLIPISARNAISSSGEVANAHSTELSPNASIPPSRTRLRPRRSPRIPQVKRRPANASV